MESVNLIDGFKIMPVLSCKQSTAVRYIFYKPHNVREYSTDKPNNRTLFLVNLPAYTDESCLARVFKKCGKINIVHFHKEPTSSVTPNSKYKYFTTNPAIKGTKVAYLVFEEESAVQTAMELSFAQPQLLSKKPLTTGLRKWCQVYTSTIPKESVMQEEINDFMREYDETVAKKEEEEKSRTGVKDDDGWVTVTKYGRKPGIARTEANEIKVELSEKKKRKKKELQNFYSFQLKESKMEHIAQLREKFEEDKNRIALLKASRKFKPY